MQRDLDEGRDFCPKGHNVNGEAETIPEFDEVELAPPAVVESETLPEPEKLSAPPPAMTTTTNPAVLVNSAPTATAATIAAVAPKPPEPKLETSKPTVEVLGKLRPAANGDLLVTLRIGEVHAVCIRAEAEMQQETCEQYLNRMLAFGLDNRWFYLLPLFLSVKLFF